MRNAGLEEAQAGIKIAGRNINNFRYADDTTLMAESEEGAKKPNYKIMVCQLLKDNYFIILSTLLPFNSQTDACPL